MEVRKPCRRRCRQGTALVFALSVALASSTSARAGDPKSEAEQSFREGRALLAAGELERACAKFTESQRLDPAAGTLLNLGECLDKRGLAASARATYLEAAKAAAVRGRTDWEKLATSRAAALEKEVSSVVIVVDQSARLKDLVITRDGVKEEWNKPIPVDAGPHVIEATAPAHRSWSTKLTVGKASALRIEIPKLEESEGASPATQPPPPPPHDTANDKDDDGANQRMLGIVAGGVGVAGLIFGGVTAIVAKGKYDDAVRLCPSYPDHCPADGSGTKANESAKSAATISTIGFIAGGVFLIGGAVLYFTAPQQKSKSSWAMIPNIATAKETGNVVTVDVVGHF